MHTTRMEKFSKTMTILKCSRLEKSLVSSTMTKRQIMGNSLFRIGQWLNLKIMQDMKESGSLIKISVKAREDKFGLTDPCTKAGGWTTKPTVKDV